MSTGLSSHIRSNVVGYIALFCFVVGGSAIAAKPGPKHAPRNSVVSRSIKNGEVKRRDLGSRAVVSSKVLDGSLTATDVDLSTLQARVSGACAPGQAIGAIGADGAVSCNSATRSVTPAVGSSGPAGGDLQGTYPNPTIAPGAVAGGKGGEIADNTVTDEDIDDRSRVFFGDRGGHGFLLSEQGVFGSTGDSHFDGHVGLDVGGLSVRTDIEEAAYGSDGVVLQGIGRGIEARYEADGVRVVGQSGAHARYGEMITLEGIPAPASPPDGNVNLFVREQAGATQLVAQFADGTLDVLAEDAP